jgi:hypothetical protein
MIPLMSLNGAQPGNDRVAQTRALKVAVRAQFGLGEDDAIFVAEVTCGESDCPDVETVIAVFLSGRRREFRIRKSVASITTQDIAGLDHRSTRQSK